MDFHDTLDELEERIDTLKEFCKEYRGEKEHGLEITEFENLQLVVVSDGYDVWATPVVDYELAYMNTAKHIADGHYDDGYHPKRTCIPHCIYTNFCDQCDKEFANYDTDTFSLVVNQYSAPESEWRDFFALFGFEIDDVKSLKFVSSDNAGEVRIESQPLESEQNA